jgi:hypothetical protein
LPRRRKRATSIHASLSCTTAMRSRESKAK